MVWPILVIIGVIVIIAYFIYKKDSGSRGYPLNRLCLSCKKRYPDNISTCPYCGQKYFS